MLDQEGLDRIVHCFAQLLMVTFWISHNINTIVCIMICRPELSPRFFFLPWRPHPKLIVAAMVCLAVLMPYIHCFARRPLCKIVWWQLALCPFLVMYMVCRLCICSWRHSSMALVHIVSLWDACYLKIVGLNVRLCKEVQQRAKVNCRHSYPRKLCVWPHQVHKLVTLGCHCC